MGKVELESGQPADDNGPPDATPSIESDAIPLSRELDETTRPRSPNEKITIPGFDFARNMHLKATPQDTMVETNNSSILAKGASDGAISKGSSFGRGNLKEGDVVGRNRIIFHFRQTHFQGK